MSLFKEEKVIYDSRIDSELAKKIHVSDKTLKSWPEFCLPNTCVFGLISCYYAFYLTIDGGNLAQSIPILTLPLALAVMPWCATPFLKMRNKQLKYQYKKKINAIEKSKSVEEKMEL